VPATSLYIIMRTARRCELKERTIELLHATPPPLSRKQYGPEHIIERQKNALGEDGVVW